MSDNLSKHDWMAGLFGKDLWNAPQDQDPGRAPSAPLDASNGADTRSASASEPNDEAASHKLTCSHQGCGYSKPFNGRWELDRHILTVHNGQKDLVCPYPGCFHGPHVSAFARPDKLTSHIKVCHARRQSDVYLACPAVKCPAPRMKLIELAAHIRSTHLVDTTPRKQRERCGEQVEIFRAIANAATWAFLAGVRTRVIL